VTAGTIFQDTHKPLALWFRAMRYVTTQKNGVSALGLQRVLGLGSYKTAWAILHKLRRTMVRPGRDRLKGIVEVDETYWGGQEKGVIGRLTQDKAMIVVAAEEDGTHIGRIRLRRVPDLTKDSLHGFISDFVEPGSTIRTDGLPAYLGLEGYAHDRQVQRRQPDGEHLLSRVHRVVSLLNRWMMGTHQGAIAQDYLDYYLDEFTFRFNRRTSKSRGKLFYRLAEQAVQPDTVVLHIANEPGQVLSISSVRLWLPRDGATWQTLWPQPPMPAAAEVPPRDKGILKLRTNKLPLTYVAIEVATNAGPVWSHLRIKRETFDISGGWVGGHRVGPPRLPLLPATQKEVLLLRNALRRLD